MKTIIVPTDYSENAWYATEYAAHVAQKTNAGIILFHGIDLPLITTEVPVDLPSLDELNRHHMARLQEIKTQLINKYHIQVTCKLSVGSVTEVLNRFFKEEKADLIIMGLRGTNPMGRLLMGSVTSTLLKRGNLPILVIPRDFSYKNIKHIMLACDFDFTCSLSPLRDIAQAFGAQVEVLRLPQPMPAGHSPERTVNYTEFENQLSGVKLEYTYLYGEDIQKGIDQSVCESHSDLLVMVPHKYSFFERMFDKNNITKMAFHTKTPLLALPAEK